MLAGMFSWPRSFPDTPKSLIRPQHAGVPSALTAHVCDPLVLICRTFPRFSGKSVDEVRPQQTGVPSVLTAHVLFKPVLIWRTVPIPIGTAGPSPQHTGVPFVLIAHVWSLPAAICLTVPIPAG